MLPKQFLNNLQTLEGINADELARAILHGNAPVSVRYNHAKLPPAQVDAEPVAWCPHAFYVPRGTQFITDPLWHAGTYYVQEASSMLLWAVLDAIYSGKEKPALILDLCAAAVDYILSHHLSVCYLSQARLKGCGHGT